jgi:hypothetical protein
MQRLWIQARRYNAVMLLAVKFGCCNHANTAIKVAQHANVSAAGVLTEQLQCQCAVSGGASSSGSTKPPPVFDITLSADVAVPLLELSRRSIEFVYTHARGSTPETMVETVQAQ